MCSCSPFFFSLLLIFTLVPAGSSHFLTIVTKLSCFSPNEICLLWFFLSFALAPSPLSMSVDVEINFSRKEDSALLLFFSP